MVDDISDNIMKMKKTLMLIIIAFLLITIVNGADIISKEIVKETDNYKLWERDRKSVV